MSLIFSLRPQQTLHSKIILHFRHAVAAWSSGTGGAGLVGAFAYAGMTEGGLTPEQALYISIAVPLLMSISLVEFLEFYLVHVL